MNLTENCAQRSVIAIPIELVFKRRNDAAGDNNKKQTVCADMPANSFVLRISQHAGVG
jgi:hypothetical protein